MTRRLKLSPDGVNSVIDIIMSDEKLIGYVMALVSKRLTKEMRDDPDWCNQVVDLSIEQVLADVDVAQLINNLCGTPTVRIKNDKNNKKERKVSKSVEPDLITPPFSSTEPHTVASSSPRRVVKEMNKKKPMDLPPASSSNAQFLKNALYSKLELDRSASVESNASTVPVVDSFNDGVIISTNTNAHAKREVEWPVSVPSERSESSISSEHENDLYVSVLDSEAQASFRDDPETASEPDSLEDTPPRGSKAAQARNELGMTQTLRVDKQGGVTLGGKNGTHHTTTTATGGAGASDRPGQKTYKVPYKPTTFDGKPKNGENKEKEKETAPLPHNTASNHVPATAHTTASTTSFNQTATATNLTPSTTTASPHTPNTPATAGASNTATPLTHTNSVHDEDFLSSWEKQVLQGMKSGEESDGEDEEGDDEMDLNALTPRASFENSFVDQLVRSPSKTLPEDLDQYELQSQHSDEQSNDGRQQQEQRRGDVAGDEDGENSSQRTNVYVGDASAVAIDFSRGATPELRVVSPHTALQLLHAPEAQAQDQAEDGIERVPSTQEPTQSKLRAQSAESDLTDPTEDSPRPQVLLHTHHHHPHHHHHKHQSARADADAHTDENGVENNENQDNTNDGDDSSASGDSYSSDSSDSEENDQDENDSTDYLRAPPTQSGQLLFFDQSRFDADADYFASEGGKKKLSPKKTGPRVKRAATDSPLRVRFAPRLISEVHYRDRVGYHEKAELFFTHNEEYQFTMDQSKEAERAEALGMTWMEWMEQRTDEDVQREEAENDNLSDFRLYSGEYYEEDEHHSSGYNSLFSDDSLHSTSVAPAGDHDFKAGNAHVSPVIAHNHNSHVLTTAQVLATHANNTNHTSATHSNGSGSGVKQGSEVVFSDELSVPSCSSDDDEYDFDNF